MSAINYLAGTQSPVNSPLPVYNEETVAFLSELSSQLMKQQETRMYPDIMSLAFWCRRANLLKLQENFADSNSRLGRGLAFHIAPSNVPVNFAFSYVFSLLAGNANIVRVSSKPFPQTQIICQVIESVLQNYPQVRKRTSIISYPAEEGITSDFCAQADARIIWGGDETVSQIRRFPVRPRCVDLVFADRYSICILDGESIASCNQVEIERLAEGFYNDTYLMDQNACSSPQMIFWVHDQIEARQRFWKALENVVKIKYDLQGMAAVDKYTQLCKDAIEHPEIGCVIRQGGNLIYRAELEFLEGNTEGELRGKAGYFYECPINSLEDICPVVSEKYQTVTYYGIYPEELRKVIMENRLRGIDRIVPVGSAMDIGVVWDGYDIISMLSRKIQMS